MYGVQMQTSTVWGIISDTQIIYHERFSIHTIANINIKQRIHIKLETNPGPHFRRKWCGACYDVCVCVCVLKDGPSTRKSGQIVKTNINDENPQRHNVRKPINGSLIKKLAT